MVENERSPDRMPPRSATRRLHYRDHLAKLQLEYIQPKSKSTRRTKKNCDVQVKLPARPNINPKGLGREIDLGTELDLNVVPE